MKSKKTKFVTVIVLILSLVISGTCFSFGASGTKTSTTYNIIKKGNYVYCCARMGIYKVNIKTGSKKRIVKEKYPDIQTPGPMLLHKGYLYYLDGGAITAPLYRVKTNGKNNKYLGGVFDFSVSKKCIYYTTFNDEPEKVLKRKMKLNGKSKKKSSYNVRTKYKNSNKKGYYVKENETTLSTDYDEYTGDYWTKVRTDYYLVTPGKKIKLCSYIDEVLE